MYIVLHGELDIARIKREVDALFELYVSITFIELACECIVYPAQLIQVVRLLHLAARFLA